jgi:hypothetical protein
LSTCASTGGPPRRRGGTGGSGERSAPAQTALIVTRLIEEGRLDTIIAEQRDELARRHAVLAGFLGPDELDGAPGVPHAWLKLPPPWRGEAFVRGPGRPASGCCRARSFRRPQQARSPKRRGSALSAAGSIERVDRAAGILRRLIETPPELAETAL